MLDTLAARDMELDEMYAIRTSNGSEFIDLIVFHSEILNVAHWHT